MFIAGRVAAISDRGPPRAGKPDDYHRVPHSLLWVLTLLHTFFSAIPTPMPVAIPQHHPQYIQFQYKINGIS